MEQSTATLSDRLGHRARRTLGRIEVLALFPLIVLLAHWQGFDDMALVTAFGLSALLAVAVLLPARDRTLDAKDPGNGKATLVAALDRIAQLEGRDSACFLIQVDDWADVVDAWGHDTAQDISTRLFERLESTLRKGDQLCRLGDARFGIVLGALSAARLGLRDTIAGRLSDAVQDAITVKGSTARLTASIGHTGLIRRAADPAEASFLAAEAALSEALRQGKGAIRAYASGMGRARKATTALTGDVEAAIKDGSITPWFQPQICARTGTVTGMEVLARWQHPDHGLMGAHEFLPAVTAAGQMAELGQSLLHGSLKALSEWDLNDVRIPAISLNLSLDELQDPGLPEILKSEVDRYDLTPDRIALDISAEIAAQHDDDMLLANLAALRLTGHRIDIESVGNGNLPLAAMQRFAANRIKIERAHVAGLEDDPTRKQTLQALLALAAALRMETLATGVETQTEADLLSEMGCDHLQGFGIARPMRSESVANWVRAHSAKEQSGLLHTRQAS